MVLRKLTWLALAVALLVGSLQVVIQQQTALPIIQAAEFYEAGLYRASTAPAASAQAVDSPAPEASGNAGQMMAQQGLTERLMWAWLANILMSFGLAVLVFSALGFYARSPGTIVRPWKLAMTIFVTGYVGFFLWPSLGMPPEIPGMDSARLGSRQLWWMMAASCAILACLLAVLMKQPVRWLAAALLLALPYLFGPPEMIGDPLARFDMEATLHMRALSKEFIYASTIGAALQWLLIGVVCSTAFVRYLLPVLRTPGNAGDG